MGDCAEAPSVTGIIGSGETEVLDVSTDASVFEPPQVAAASGEGIVAEVRLDHDALVCRPTLRTLPDVRIVPESRAGVATGTQLLFLAVLAEDYERFERVLADDPTVEDPVLVDRFVDRRVYRVTMTQRALTVVDKLAAVGGRTIDATGTTTGWVFQIRLPTRDALVAFNEECSARDVSVSVTQLRSATPDDTVLLGLTDKQQELLTIAYDEGYFDVPRGISQDELADRLGVSKSAISQRLRRAMGTLCSTSLEP